MAGPGICVLCLADTCTSEVHPVFNPIAPYGYLLSDMYLFMADITNPDFLVYSCRTWIGLDITRFCGPGICVLCLADTCTSEVHPVFNPIAPYGYLLSDMYLFVTEITNPNDWSVFVCVCRRAGI